LKRVSIIALALFFPLACAVPVPPGGGPPDSTPPSVISTTPSDGQTSFSGDVIEFEFDEAVDLRSFIRAFSISPDLSGPTDISGSGKRMRVKLPDELRDSTTYIVTIDASLRDVRSVTLDAPIILAFSTGGEIDAGVLSGKVVRALDGSNASAVDVFAYTDDDSTTLAQAPLYRTQSAANGVFSFKYLSEREYVVVAVNDANRNRLIDDGEAYGISPDRFISADTIGTAPILPWVLAMHDNVAPNLERVRALTHYDLELRFSEPLDLDLNNPFEAGVDGRFSFALEDSLGRESADIHSLYFRESGSRTVFARTDSMASGNYRLTGGAAISDSSGNQMTSGNWDFTVNSGLPPIAAPEFLSWLPDSMIVTTSTPRRIWQLEDLGVRLDAPSNEIELEIQDTTGTDLQLSVDLMDATSFVIGNKQRNALSEPFVIRLIQSADSARTGVFQFTQDRSSGALVLETDDAEGPVIVEVFDRASSGGPIARGSSETASVLIDGLPGGLSARLRAWVDLDGNGRWDPGSLSPYQPSEPIGWIESDEPVRARWDTVLPDTLRFSGIEAAPADSSTVGSIEQ